MLTVIATFAVLWFPWCACLLCCSCYRTWSKIWHQPIFGTYVWRKKSTPKLQQRDISITECRHKSYCTVNLCTTLCQIRDKHTRYIHMYICAYIYIYNMFCCCYGSDVLRLGLWPSVLGAPGRTNWGSRIRPIASSLGLAAPSCACSLSLSFYRFRTMFAGLLVNISHVP